jgi:hypothetical protein
MAEALLQGINHVALASPDVDATVSCTPLLRETHRP